MATKPVENSKSDVSKTIFDATKMTSENNTQMGGIMTTELHERQLQDMDKLIAKELNDLTIHERGQVYEEVHGVSRGLAETPEFVRQSLQQMEDSIEKDIPDERKESYVVAYHKSPQYVSNDKFRLMFLRAESFNPSLAAKRFVDFHSGIRQYFGLNALGRDLTLADLDKDDMEALSSGFIQRLAKRDAAGRGIICDVTFLIPRKFYKSVDNLVRAAIYFTTTMIMQDEISQIRGLVAIVYCVDNDGTSMFANRDIIDHEGSNKLSALIRWLPYRYTAFHLCANALFLRACEPLIKWMIGTMYRVRLRIHSGTSTECQYDLMTYGIPVSVLPLSYDCNVKTTTHTKWINRQRMREHKLRLLGSFGGIDFPADEDVLFGRGRDRYYHRGNVMMRHYVESYRTEYESAGYGDKLRIASVIVTLVKRQGGRFLQADKDGWWVEVDDTTASDKASHAFRTLRIDKGSSHDGDGRMKSTATSSIKNGIKKARTAT